MMVQTDQALGDGYDSDHILFHAKLEEVTDAESAEG